jgi:hypothetical protein
MPEEPQGEKRPDGVKAVDHELEEQQKLRPAHPSRWVDSVSSINAAHVRLCDVGALRGVPVAVAQFEED